MTFTLIQFPFPCFSHFPLSGDEETFTVTAYEINVKYLYSVFISTTIQSVETHYIDNDRNIYKEW